VERNKRGIKNKLYIGIDIGGTKISAGLVTDRGNILASRKLATPLSAKPDEIGRHIIDLIAFLMPEGSTAGQNLVGIGAGVPGIVDNDDKTILATPNIDLAGFPLARRLEAKYRVPVVLGNDVNLGTLGEKWMGSGQKAENIVGIFVGTGIGGAVIAEGKLLTGTFGAAAELGHMTVQLDGPACGCGNRGCFEALAGRRAIERAIQQAMRKGKKTVVTKLTNGRNKVIKSRVLKEALKKRDPLVTRVMKEEAMVLGRACVSINHIFNPEMIILGGGVIKACGDFLLPKVRKFVQADPFFNKFNRCAVVPSQLGDDAVILGAVALVKERVLDHL